MYYDYQDYLSRPHYRAFAATSGAGSLAASLGFASNRKSIEEAIERALAGCRKGQKKYFKISKCRLYAVGDTIVAGFSEERINRAITQYYSNRYATNVTLSRDAAKMSAKMSGAELQELFASGAKVSGTYKENTKYTIEHKPDGTATISWQNGSDSGSDTGIWQVIMNSSCKKWGSLFDGARRCWTIFRADDGSYQTYLGSLLVATWSVVE